MLFILLMYNNISKIAEYSHIHDDIINLIYIYVYRSYV